MFKLSSFIKKGLLDAVGKMADYWVIMNAVGWMEKGVLSETDLAEINEAIEALHPAELPDGVDTGVEEEQKEE